MTLLTRKVIFYFRCSTGHRFERAKFDAFPSGFCPKCGMPIKCYGLADSTRYTGDPGGADAEGS